MSNCVRPLLAARLYKPLIGKSVIKILPKRVDQGYNEVVSKYGRENLFFLPCGHCPACISRRKKEWSIRCCMEAMDHEKNCFVTLTYSPEYYPGLKRDDVRRKDIQLFIKTLRNKGISLRYFGCCERGDTTDRYHMHIILFGFCPEDMKYHSKSKGGVDIFTSKIIDDAWSKGICTVQEFSPNAASYVAGYCLKKMIDCDDSFHVQSTRPGIGAAYFLRHVEDIYDTDKLVLNFGSHIFSVPRYFDKLAESLDMDLSDIKEARMNKSLALTYKAINESGYANQEELFFREGMAQIQEFRYRKRSI